MNQLNATIKSIETEENISLVTMQATGMLFTTLVIDTPATAGYLQEGKEVIMVFKESAMSIAKKFSGSLSIRNRFPAIITGIKSGKVLTAVSLHCADNQLTSVITTHAANELALTVGDAVEGLVKTNDISLMQKE